MKIKFSLRLAALVFLLAFLLGIPRVTSPVYAKDTGQNHEILFSIPVGDEGIHYSGTEHPGMLVWGPAAMTVASNGNFWIADTAGNQLLQYDQGGILLNKISIEDFVVGAGDIEVTPKSIWLLDEASEPPKIVRMTLDGKNLRTYELPAGLRREDGLSGIALGENNQILVELEGGNKLIRFLTAGGKVNPKLIKGYWYGGKLYKAQPANLQSKNTSQGLITVGDKRVDVTVHHELGGLRLLGRHKDNSVFVVAEELIVAGGLRVDQTVHHYDAGGGLVGIARIPLSDQYTTVSHGLAIGTDGAAYTLITKPDHVEIQRLRFSEELVPILPPSPAMNATDNITPNDYTSLACRYRSSMLTTARSYAENFQYINNTNINGTCANRTKPHYLTIAGNYNSVSYDWSGFDSVSAWNSYMTNNYQAGDIDTSGNEGCSKGVDCSGFISRVWGLTQRYGTCTIENISSQLSGTSQLLRGDIMNKCNVHTIMFDSFASNGMYGYESTTYNNHDRVISIYRSWSSISTYVPRRYNSVCP